MLRALECCAAFDTQSGQDYAVGLKQSFLNKLISVRVYPAMAVAPSSCLRRPSMLKLCAPAPACSLLTRYEYESALRSAGARAVSN